MRSLLSRLAAAAFAGSTLLRPALEAQQPSIETRLEGFDAYVQPLIKDWNVPGIGIVVKDKLVMVAIV